MRPVYDDFDDLDFEFADSATIRQMLREQEREQRRLASRRAFGPASKRKRREYQDPYDDYDEDYGEYADYDDYDDDEFDSYTVHGPD